MTILEGELVNVDTNRFTPKTIEDNLAEFISSMLIFQKIDLYMKNPLYSDKIEDLVGLAIVDTILSTEEKNKDWYSQEGKVSFIFGLMKGLTVELKRSLNDSSNDSSNDSQNDSPNKKFCIHSPEVLSNFNYQELFNMVELVFNNQRGEDYVYTSILPAVKIRYESIPSLLEAYLEVTPNASDTLSDILLKIGYSKKEQ